MPDPAVLLRAGLAGRYQVERELGRGGMARVYLARDVKHDRPVALKVLHPELSVSLGAERFLHEVRIAARLQHPNILPVLDSGDVRDNPGVLWYTMPYVEGESLRDRLRQEVQLPLEDAVAIAAEVAEALEYAHSEDILHRDIKPENILLSRGHALVTDFGIARALGSGGAERLTETGLALGTPAYMSPEQASGTDQLDRRSDLYSLGCVLFEMLAGEPPFTGPTVQAVIAKRFTEGVPSTRRGGRPVPPALDGIVARALAPVPADRYSTAAGLRAALRKGEPWTLTGAEPTAAAPSIAVLPFANLTPSTEDEYFADGMTDELINALGKICGLHVVSRTSAFAFKGRPEDAREIGRRLHVRTVLEGSVRRAGPRLRVSTQLINVADGFLLWSETFDRVIEDVFAIQDEISRAIAGALRVRLLAPQREVLVRPPTDDLEAYTLYLKGRHFWNRRTEQDLRRGLGFFEQAVARDAGFALAHAGIADSWALLGFYSLEPPSRAFPTAKRAALDALAHAPGLAEAHPALAYVALYYEWNWTEAERAFQRAIELQPGYATAHQWYGNFLSVTGRDKECIAEFGKAAALDPLSALRFAALGWGYYFARRYQEAEAECRRGIELDPANVVAQSWLGLALLGQERLGEALAAFEEAGRISARGVSSLGFLGHAYAVAGRAPEARALLRELTELSNIRYVSQYDLGLIHLALGEPDEAVAWLQRGYAERDHQMVFLRADPRLDPLRGRAEFAELVGRMGFRER
jgi:serine/threonine-protein kinase